MLDVRSTKYDVRFGAEVVEGRFQMFRNGGNGGKLMYDVRSTKYDLERRK
jgi:hypothetical protein